ncbi:MAG: hypothetical protein AAGC96_15805, partial [Pseudomonadota bacterium]
RGGKGKNHQEVALFIAPELCAKCFKLASTHVHRPIKLIARRIPAGCTSRNPSQFHQDQF